MAGPVGQEQRIAGAQQLLAATAVQDGAAVDLGAHPVAEAARQVGLDHARHHVHAGALGGQDQVDAHGAGLLGDARDAVLHLAAGHHHEVGQLVDDHQHVGQGLQQGGTVRPARVGRAVREVHGAAGVHDLGVEALQVADAEQREAAVAVLHLGHHPLEDAARLLHVGHDGCPQVGDVLVDAELHHLGIHEDELHLVGHGAHQAGADHGVHAHALAAAGAAADEQVRHLVEVRHHRSAGDVLAKGEVEQAASLSEGGAIDDLAEGDDLPLGVGHLDAHQVLARDAIHAHGLGLQGQGQILLHAEDAREGDARVRLELEHRDHGAGLHARDDALDLELGQLLSNLLLDDLELSQVHLGVLAGGIEEPAGRQRLPVGQGGARRLGRQRGQRLDRGGLGEGQGRLDALPAEAVLGDLGADQGRLGGGCRRGVGEHLRAEGGGGLRAPEHRSGGGQRLGLDHCRGRVQVQGVDGWEQLLGPHGGLVPLRFSRLHLGLQQGLPLGLQGLLAPLQGQERCGVAGVEVGLLGVSAPQEGALHHADEVLETASRHGLHPGPGLLAKPPGQQPTQGAREGGGQHQGAEHHQDEQEQRQAHGAQEAALHGPEDAAQPAAPAQRQGAGLGQARPEAGPEGAQGRPGGQAQPQPGQALDPAALGGAGPGLPQQVGRHQPAADAQERLQQPREVRAHGAAEVLHRRDGRTLREEMGIQGVEAAQGEQQHQGENTQPCSQYPAADSLQHASPVVWVQCSPAEPVQRAWAPGLRRSASRWRGSQSGLPRS